MFTFVTWAVLAAAQTITFSPQQAAKSNARLTLWAVDISAPGKNVVAASTVYAIAASHQVGHVDPVLAGVILQAKASHSPASVAVEILGAGSAATAVGTVIKDGGFLSQGTGAQVQNIASIVAAASAIVLPYVKQSQSLTPNSAIAAELLGSSLRLDSSGSASALFYSLPSKVAAFVEKLP